MRKYIVPELEITKFNMQDVLTVSGDPIVVPSLANGGTIAAFGGDGNYSQNDLKWTN